MEKSVLFENINDLLFLLRQKSKATLTPTRIHASIFLLCCEYNAFSNMSQQMHHLPAELITVEFEATSYGPRTQFNFDELASYSEYELDIDPISTKIINLTIEKINNLNDEQLSSLVKQNPVFLDAWEFGPGTVLDKNDLIALHKNELISSLER